MDELSPSARALLRAADASDDPTTDDANRVRRAVLLQVGAVGVGASTFAAKAAQAQGLFGSLGAKLGAALLVAAGASGVTYLVSRSESGPPVAIVRAPTSVAPVELEPKPVPVAPAPAAPEAPAPREGRVRRAPVETAPSASPDLEAEMKLIRSADSALRAGRTSEALALLATHSKAHPKGLLTQERRGLDVLARCQSNAGPRSLKAAEAFLSAAPRSPLSPRIRSACGIEK
jgi:hypothetical protein